MSEIEILARDLLNKDISYLDTLPNELVLQFDDGVKIRTTRHSCQYSHYFWEIHRRYGNMPVIESHFVDYVLKGKPLGSKTHMMLLENISKTFYQVYNTATPADRQPLLKLIYDITNNVYNEITQLSEPFVTSIDILDFIEITELDSVKEATSKVTESEVSISQCYDSVTAVLQKDPRLNKNPVSIAVRADIVSLNQVLQCVAVRGKVTEVDGKIIPTPILSNFTKGLNSLFEYAAESRSAAKSQFYQDSKLQEAEYFARRIQLVSMVVQSIAYVDCGSTETINWRVIPPSYDENGFKTYKGDLVFMIGKNYYDDNNVLRQITHDDPNLYGKELRLRTVLYCKHPDPHAVCEVCFGGLARNVPEHANIGHLSAATMTQQITQSVLSIKHIDKSSTGTAITLNEVSSRYFRTDSSHSAYYINSSLKNKNVKITISRDEAIGLIDILHIDNLDSISPVRISDIECVEITTTDKATESSMMLYVSQGNKKAMLTLEFLKYVKVNRVEIDSRNNFIFDLNNWDFDKPIFKLPEMEYSFSDHAEMIARVIESNMKKINERSQPYSPLLTLQELFSLVNTKINVNMAALEVIIYSTMVAEPGAYSLGRNAENPVLGIANQIIKNRSLGVGFMYQHMHLQLTNPKSFFKGDRCSSIFDVFLCPQEYLEHYKSKNKTHL